jgi:acyl-CoA synthetase (AMP-forming)/AMP-acid ligase II
MTPPEFLLHPDAWLRKIGATKATISVGPNFAYELVARRVRELPGVELGSLRVALNGSEPVQRSTISAFEDRFMPNGLRPGVVLPVYGLAEATLGVSFTRPGEPIAPDLVWDGRKIPAVGHALAGVEIELRDKAGRLVPLGSEGEIVVRSPSLMDGYFGHVDAQPIEEGWLKTGDLGVIQNGALYVTGREKDLVIKGGQKFHPYEIERVAAEAVPAAPNGVAAFAKINPASGTEDLIVMVELRAVDQEGAEKKIRGELLGALGVRADRILIVRPGELPRTTSGKIRRSACQALVDAP